MAIRILLIEPQRLFREGFRALLRTQPDFEVVGDAGDATAALSIAAASAPQVAVIDSAIVAHPDFTLLRDLAQLPAPPKIIALEPAPAGRGLLHRVGDGVSGIVCKDDSADEAFTAIRTIAAGRTWVTPHLLRAANAETHRTDPRDTLLRSLTAREQEIFDLVLRGRNTAAIARQLSLSPRTVETHRAHVMRKLGVHSMVDLVRIAARHGVLPS